MVFSLSQSLFVGFVLYVVRPRPRQTPITDNIVQRIKWNGVQFITTFVCWFCLVSCENCILNWKKTIETIYMSYRYTHICCINDFVWNYMKWDSPKWQNVMSLNFQLAECQLVEFVISQNGQHTGCTKSAEWQARRMAQLSECSKSQNVGHSASWRILRVDILRHDIQRVGVQSSVSDAFV